MSEFKSIHVCESNGVWYASIAYIEDGVHEMVSFHTSTYEEVADKIEQTFELFAIEQP